MRFSTFLCLLFLTELIHAQTANFSKQTPTLLENKGQVSNSDGTPADQVLYSMNTPNMDFYLTKQGITYVFKKGILGEEDAENQHIPAQVKEVQWHRVDVTPLGGSLNVDDIKLTYSKQGTVSIFNQLVPEGIEHIRPVESVTFKNVYPGIDWQFVVEQNFLKYNFILHPGADLSQIRLQFEGQDKIALENNRLIIESSLGNLTEDEIISFTSSKKTVDVKAVLEENILTYHSDAMPTLAKGEILTIDPPLVWSTYFGGGVDDYALVMERNSNGFIYVLLSTSSNDFPVLDKGGITYYQGTYIGNEDIGILKFTEDGIRVWATYYGGIGEDHPVNLFYNGSFLIVVGYTTSGDFPIHNPGIGNFFDDSLGGSNDGFIIAFTLADYRLWSTYIGGSTNGPSGTARDEINDCSMQDGKLIITGQTTSSDYPVLANGSSYFDNSVAFMDVFVTEFSNTFAMTWSTYLGGNDNDLFPYCDIDSLGRIGLTYATASSNLPLINSLPGSYLQTYSAGTDFGITLFDTSRQILWQTYYGNTGNELGNDIICDYNNNWILVGYSDSPNFPVINTIGASFYQPVKSTGTDAVLMKFGENGQQLYSSFYGGTGIDAANGVTIDSYNNLYIVGYSYSPNLATYDPLDGSYFDNSINGGSDEFLIELDSNFTTIWATYLGGSANERLMDVRVSPSDHVFAVGYSYSTNHPTIDPGLGAYFDNSRGGTRDAIIMKFIPCPENFDTIWAIDSVCYGESINIYATGSQTYLWNNGSTNDTIPNITIVSDTSFSIRATYLTCIEHDTVYIKVKPLPVITFTGDSMVCINDSMYLGVDGGINYVWENGFTTDSISFLPAASETLTVTVTNSYGCTSQDSIQTTVYPLPIPTITGNNNLCLYDTTTIIGGGGVSYLWSTTAITPSIDIVWTTTGVFDYHVIVTDTNGCSDTAFHQITVHALPFVYLGSDTTLCVGNSLLLDAGNNGSSYSWSNGETTDTISVSIADDYYVLVTDSNLCQYSDTILVDVIPYSDATVSDVDYICNNGSPFNYTAAESGGVWSGTGIVSPVNGTFDPLVAGLGFFTIVYAIDGICGDADSSVIEVTPIPVIDFTTTDETCPDANDGTVFISGSSGTAPYVYMIDSIIVADTTVGLPPNEYLLTIIDSRGCTQTDSVNILSEEFPCGKIDFYIPNIFSPNGDNQNDLLFVRSDFIFTMDWYIYDRFGEKVFESKDINIGWDGEYHGQPVQDGVYFWYIKVTFINEDVMEREGNVTVVR